MVDELALRTICPLVFSVARVASTIPLGVELVSLLVTGARKRLLLLVLIDNDNRIRRGRAEQCSALPS
jgi:hypothetical protein